MINSDDTFEEFEIEKKELLDHITKEFRHWLNIESEKNLNEFKNYVIISNVRSENWGNTYKNIKNIINDYDEMYLEWLKEKEIPKVKQPKKQTKQDIEKLQEKARIVERYETNKEKFIKLFSQYSVHNRDMGETYYHLFLGVLCKKNGHQIHTVTNKLVWPITHVFAIQDSGSGKDQGVDFIIDLVDLYNLESARYNKQFPIGDDRRIPAIKYIQLSGSETMEAYLDSFPKDASGQYRLRRRETDSEGRQIMVDEEPLPGIFGSNDMIFARECSFLFMENKNSDKQSKTEIFLQVLEGRSVPKTLNSWRDDGRQFWTYTTFDGAFLGTSRPIRNMKAHLAHSGLQQRGLNICRKLSSEDRRIMNDEIKLLRRRSKEEWQKIEKEKEELVKEFVELSEFIKKNGMPKISDQNRMGIADMVGDAINTMQIETCEQFKNPDHRDIMLSFVSRYNFHIDILAAHNALSRYQKEITDIDYQNALSLLNKSYGYMSLWVEENVEENFYAEKKRESNEVKMKNIFHRQPKWLMANLRKEIMANLRVGYQRSYQIINEWKESGMLIEKNEDGNRYFLLGNPNQKYFKGEKSDQKSK